MTNEIEDLFKRSQEAQTNLVTIEAAIAEEARIKESVNEQLQNFGVEENELDATILVREEQANKLKAEIEADLADLEEVVNTAIEVLK